jgi:uncharacterized membrane protein
MPSRFSTAIRLGLVIGCALAVAWPHGAVAQDTYRLKIFERSGDTSFYPLAINGLGHLAGLGPRADGMHTIRIKGDVVEDLGVVGPIQWHPTALNDRGQMVGYYTSVDFHNVASWWGRQGPKDLGRVGDTSYADAINDHGEVAGSTIFVRDDGSLTERMTIWYRGRATFSREGGYVVYGSGINNAGQVSGAHKVGSSDPSRAVVWDQGTMTFLGGDNSSAYAINDRGQVVGVESNSAKLWQNGEVINLGAQVPGWSWAADINEGGDIVGLGDFPRRSAVLWRQLQLIDLNTLLRPGAPEAGWWLTQASRINNRGDIIGTATNPVICPQMNCSWGYVLTRSALPDEYPVDAGAEQAADDHALKLLRTQVDTGAR